MSSEPISFEKLMEAYNSVKCVPDIMRYEIADDGVVYFYGSDGQVTGMTSREGLQYLLDNAPK